ncbi:MAG: hypothetical protein VKP62_12485 [Candidatus Sericytochromatia bacterium]|nr:hypothetical protein [Candidatus Sericytochromatia bacterium]
MNVAPEQLILAIESALSATSGASSRDDEVGQAAAFIAQGVRRPGQLIDLEMDDVSGLIEDLPASLLNVRVFEDEELCGQSWAFAPWLREVDGAVIEVLGGPDLTLFEVSQLTDQLYAWMPAEVQVVLGAALAQSLQGHLRLRIVGLRRVSSQAP